MTTIRKADFDPDYGVLTIVLNDGTTLSVKARIIGELPPIKVTENDD